MHFSKFQAPGSNAYPFRAAEFNPTKRCVGRIIWCEPRIFDSVPYLGWLLGHSRFLRSDKLVEELREVLGNYKVSSVVRTFPLPGYALRMDGAAAGASDVVFRPVWFTADDMRVRAQERAVAPFPELAVGDEVELTATNSPAGVGFVKQMLVPRLGLDVHAVVEAPSAAGAKGTTEEIEGTILTMPRTLVFGLDPERAEVPADFDIERSMPKQCVFRFAASDGREYSVKLAPAALLSSGTTLIPLAANVSSVILHGCRHPNGVFIATRISRKHA